MITFLHANNNYKIWAAITFHYIVFCTFSMLKRQTQLSISLFGLPLSIPICLSVCLSIHPSACLTVCLSVCLSVSLSVYLNHQSICSHIYLPMNETEQQTVVLPIMKKSGCIVLSVIWIHYSGVV